MISCVNTFCKDSYKNMVQKFKQKCCGDETPEVTTQGTQDISFLMATQRAEADIRRIHAVHNVYTAVAV